MAKCPVRRRSETEEKAKRGNEIQSFCLSTAQGVGSSKLSGRPSSATASRGSSGGGGEILYADLLGVLLHNPPHRVFGQPVPPDMHHVW